MTAIDRLTSLCRELDRELEQTFEALPREVLHRHPNLFRLRRKVQVTLSLAARDVDEEWSHVISVLTEDQIDELERDPSKREIRRTLRKYGGNVTAAARHLGYSPTTLKRKLGT